MEYQANNKTLLQKLYSYLLAFPFDERTSSELQSLNLDKIYAVYFPYSDMEQDEVANGICWSARTLENLLNRKPERTLDEVISFVKSLIEKCEEKGN